MGRTNSARASVDRAVDEFGECLAGRRELWMI